MRIAQEPVDQEPRTGRALSAEEVECGELKSQLTADATPVWGIGYQKPVQ